MVQDHESRSKVTQVKVKGHIGQGQPKAHDIDRWASHHRQVASLGIRVVGVPFWDFRSHPSKRRIRPFCKANLRTSKVKHPQDE